MRPLFENMIFFVVWLILVTIAIYTSVLYVPLGSHWTVIPLVISILTLVFARVGDKVLKEREKKREIKNKGVLLQ